MDDEQIDIRALLKTDFGVDLPIRGGSGNSIDNPVIIEKIALNDYVGTEYAFLKYIGRGRRISWKPIGNVLMTHNGRKIDKIRMQFLGMPAGQDKIENYYFDITECFG